MGSRPARPEQDIDRYLQALWVRSAVIHAARALCAAAGVFAAVLLVMALSTGPVVSVTLSRSLLGLAALCAIAAAGWAAAPLWRVGRAHRHRLLGARSPTLASHARSALQLARSASENGSGAASPTLVAAHADSVRTAVLAAPASEAVPWRGLNHATTALGLCGCAFVASIFFASETARTGARALLTPATIGKSGVRIARVVETARGTLTFPSYLERAPEQVAEVTQLAVPRGTTVELSIRPILPARHGAVVIGEEVVRLAQSPSGALTGKLVARSSGPLSLRVLHDELWYEDNEARALVVQDDRAPEVKLVAGPLQGAVVQPTDVVGLGFEATDDHGLATVELALRLPSGEETRQRLWSTIGQKPTGQLASQAEIAIERLGLRPGDIVLAWIEARDADVVSGPHVGASRTVTLEVATDAQELSMQIPALRAVLDSALDVLALRLESALPDAPVMARQRFEELREATDAWLVMLHQLIEAAGRAESEGLDVDQLRGIADRTRRELAREGTAYEGTPPAKRLVDADARMVAEQERDVLLLADMLASALVDEARALTNELNAIKEHMRELLDKLKKAPTAEAKRELLAELAKAQRRLRDLAQSLSRLSQRVPSEFINREAIPQNDAKSSMDGLQAAIEAGDMEEAERQLEALSQQIDQLAQHVDQGGARFRESRFGEHDKAVAQARNQLSMLSAEQERLASRSREVVQDAARRAQQRGQQQGQDSSGMQQLAQGAQNDLETLGEPNGSSSDGQLLGQARERARDVADALRTGDLAEARRMSAAAQRSLDSLARSLEHDAQMFPGHQGETRARAQAAANAAGKLRRLQEQLDQAMPPLDDFMGDDERARLRGDVPQQKSAREMAEKLGQEMGQETGGTPISPDAQRGLQEVSESMRRAENALGQGDADEASRSQEEAADKLRQIEQGMAQKGKRQNGRDGERQGQRGEGRENEGGDGKRADGPVKIPGADDFTGPVEMRRRVLDAMREEGPSGFESALQRYYEGLLR